jgi:IclR family KDG regulon transcriptional repressor
LTLYPGVNYAANGNTVATMIASVARSVQILEALGQTPGGMTVGQLVTAVKIEKSVVSRIVTTLTDEQYLFFDAATHRYRLGLKFIALGLRQLDNLGIYGLVTPRLQDIADKLGELVQLALVEGTSMRYVAKVDCKDRIQMHSLIGQKVVLHAATAGKVWLASLPEEEALKIALNDGLPAFTPRTITRIEDFRKELRKVRERGYAMVVEELIPGGTAVGVPIYGERTGSVVGAIVVSAPSFRLSVKRAQTMVPTMNKAAADLRAIELWIHGAGPQGNLSDNRSAGKSRRARETRSAAEYSENT